MNRPPYAWQRIWAWPIALGAASLLGLVLALFDDAGPLDVFAWFALGCLVLVCAWFGLLANRRS